MDKEHFKLSAYMKASLILMLDDEPAALGLSEALALSRMGLISDGEHQLDGWYYKLNAAGRAAATELRDCPSGASAAPDLQGKE